MAQHEIENNIVDAIELLTKDTIAKARLDKTVIATVVSCVNKVKGIYNVKYQEATVEAYSSPNASYQNTDRVYMLIPMNDIEADKFILGKVGGNTYNGANERELTKAEYEALSEDERINGYTYYITDEDSGGGGGSVTVDDTLSTTSENPVQNKVITNNFSNYATTSSLASYATTADLQNYATTSSLTNYATTSDLANKQDILTAGTNITIENNVISAAGGGDNFLTKVDPVGSGKFSFGSSVYISKNNSISLGEKTSAVGMYAQAFGYQTSAGGYSMAIGNKTTADSQSFSCGSMTLAKNQSFACGGMGQATGNYCSVIGGVNYATYSCDFAGGDGTTASGGRSLAFGQWCKASSSCSMAFGHQTTSNALGQFVVGRKNITDSNLAFIVGNGTTAHNSSGKSNAFTVDWSGNVVAAGDLTVKYNNAQYSLSTIIQALIDNNILS